MTSNEQQDVLVLSGTRTAIGKYGGGLTDLPPRDLAATVVREAVRRAGLPPGDMGHAVSGRPGTGRQSFRQPREVVQ